MFHYFIIKFHFSFFASFRFKFFPSLQSKTKRSENQVYFFAFFRFFSFFFTLNFSLRFDFVIFASKQNEGETFSLQKKQNSIFFAFFRFPISFRVKKKTFLSIFSLNFRCASIFSLNFRLFYLRFCFRFLVFRMEVNHVKSGFFSLPSEQKFSLQFQISLPQRK